VTLGQFDEPDDEVGEELAGLHLVAGSRLVLDDASVRLAVSLVDHMDVLDRVQDWKAQAKRSPGGRPEDFRLRALLVAAVLCALTDQPLHLSRMTDVMFRQLSSAWRATLGIPDPPAEGDVAGWKAAYRTVRYRFHGLLSLVCGRSVELAIGDQRNSR
jgi:hypothetical protein